MLHGVCYICHGCLFLLFVDHQVNHHHFVSLVLKVSRDLSFVILNHVCWTISLASLHSLHLGCCLVWCTPAPIGLVLSACSCAAVIRASVLSSSPVYSRHWQGLSR